VTTGPSLPKYPTGNAPVAGKDRGEKQWQQWAQDFVDWEDGQTHAANTRLPYASTLLQTGDYVDDEAGAAHVDDILSGITVEETVSGTEKVEPTLGNVELVHIADDEGNELVKIEDSNSVPIGFHFVQTNANDDDPSKMESLMMEDPGIPLNMRFLQTGEGERLVLKHTVNNFGDELIRFDRI